MTVLHLFGSIVDSLRRREWEKERREKEKTFRRHPQNFLKTNEQTPRDKRFEEEKTQF